MVLERIREAYPTLTKSQRRLADYVAESYREVALMTASKLGKRLSVNEATVIRFAQKLGYPGYPAFVQDVRAIVRGEWQGSAPEGDQAAELSGILERCVSDLSRVVSQLPMDTLQQVVDTLQAAGQVYVTSAGLIAPVGQLLSSGLQGMGVPSRVVDSDASGVAMALADLKKGDALVVVSTDEPASLLARALLLADKAGVRTVALTTSPVAPSARSAKLALSCLPATSDLALAILPLAMLVDAILVLVGRADRKRQTARTKALDKWRAALNQEAEG